MSVVAGDIDAAQLQALSRRLGIPSRQLLVAAARLAGAEPALAADPAYRQRVLDDAKSESAAAETAARVLLTPVADYSINELDRLFAEIWPAAATAGDE